MLRATSVLECDDVEQQALLATKGRCCQGHPTLDALCHGRLAGWLQHYHHGQHIFEHDIEGRDNSEFP